MSIVTVVRAARPDFLVLAPLCILLGVSIAARQPVALDPLEVALVLIGGLLAHAVVNLLNEYEDFRSGLDAITQRTPFSGGSGALPASPSAATGVLITALVMLATVLVIGVYFLWLRGWPMLIPGLGGLILMVAYTRWLTRSPLACLLAPGLGFGPGMVLGSLVALGGHVDGMALLGSGVALLLVSELLLINQFPDVEADRRIGRRHLPIVLGLPRASLWVAVLLLGAYAMIAMGRAAQLLPAGAWLAWLTLPAALWVALRLPRALDDRRALMRVMGVNVATLLATLALLSAGFFLALR
ncbi:prenyltransferase [Modicisalibacter radicis]|uniref:prenyltransferase n=1 Tax=Halomonas sp. EAR18 TaxID=2518972 RepID=UPI00109CCDA4|nr:prenyltransferase [Halomonas sp. EAR18]